MKRYKVLAFASVFALGLTSCGDFGDTNIDPEHLNEGNVPTAMLFSNGQHQALGSDWDIWRNACIHSSQWIQHMTSIQWWEDYGRYTWSDAYSGAYWDTYSGDRGAMRDITTAYDTWKDADGMQIDWNIARVMRVYAFSKMTDLYGDIPYSQAGRPSEYSYPEYDTQESIYKSMLAELDEAQANLGSGTAQMKSQDVYFQGDAASWKRFANSLMLRLAMRLVKVDEGTAKSYAAKALANGLITSNDENVKLDHPGGVTTNDSAEPFAKINAHEDKEFFMSKTFIDILKNSNDPRLALIATVCENPSLSRAASTSMATAIPPSSRVSPLAATATVRAAPTSSAMSTAVLMPARVTSTTTPRAMQACTSRAASRFPTATPIAIPRLRRSS